MRCLTCGSPVHPGWYTCRGCGAELRSQRPRSAARALPALPRASAMSAIQRAAARAGEHVRTLRMPALQIRAPRISTPHIGAPRIGTARLSSGLVPVLGMLVVLLAVGALALASSAASARAEAARAQEAERVATERLAAVQAMASGAEQARGDASSAAQQAEASVSKTVAERDELARRLDAATKDATAIQAKLMQATASAEQQTALVGQQRQQLRVLTECLSGTLVAVEFGRSGRWSSADRALEAVKDSCTAARALL